MKKITGIPGLTQPTLTTHEHCNPYDRQSSRTSFNATATSYIQVTKNFTLHVETASPYKGHTSRTFFARLLDLTSGLLRHTSGLPKILPWLRLTLLFSTRLELHLPTIQEDACTSIVGLLPQDGE